MVRNLGVINHHLRLVYCIFAIYRQVTTIGFWEEVSANLKGRASFLCCNDDDGSYRLFGKRCFVNQAYAAMKKLDLVSVVRKLLNTNCNSFCCLPECWCFCSVAFHQNITVFFGMNNMDYKIICRVL